MNNAGGDVVARTPHKPGELMGLVAGGLAGRGFDIQYPRHDDPCAFAIAGINGVTCRVAVGDCGSVQLDWTPAAGGKPDPQAIADMAACLLTGGPADGERAGRTGGTGHLTFKGIVAQDLKARGFKVDLEVFRDEAAFEALVVVVASSQGGEDFSVATVSDDGSLLWEHDYWPECADITPGPEFSSLPTRRTEIADDAVQRISQAISAAAIPDRTQATGQESNEQ